MSAVVGCAALCCLAWHSVSVHCVYPMMKSDHSRCPMRSLCATSAQKYHQLLAELTLGQQCVAAQDSSRPLAGQIFHCQSSWHVSHWEEFPCPRTGGTRHQARASMTGRPPSTKDLQAQQVAAEHSPLAARPSTSDLSSCPILVVQASQAQM